MDIRGRRRRKERRKQIKRLSAMPCNGEGREGCLKQPKLFLDFFQAQKWTHRKVSELTQANSWSLWSPEIWFSTVYLVFTLACIKNVAPSLIFYLVPSLKWLFHRYLFLSYGLNVYWKYSLEINFLTVVPDSVVCCSTYSWLWQH